MAQIRPQSHPHTPKVVPFLEVDGPSEASKSQFLEGAEPAEVSKSNFLEGAEPSEAI